MKSPSNSSHQTPQTILNGLDQKTEVKSMELRTEKQRGNIQETKSSSVTRGTKKSIIVITTSRRSPLTAKPPNVLSTTPIRVTKPTSKSFSSPSPPPIIPTSPPAPSTFLPTSPSSPTFLKFSHIASPPTSPLVTSVWNSTSPNSTNTPTSPVSFTTCSTSTVGKINNQQKEKKVAHTRTRSLLARFSGKLERNQEKSKSKNKENETMNKETEKRKKWTKIWSTLRKNV